MNKKHAYICAAAMFAVSIDGFASTVNVPGNFASINAAVIAGTTMNNDIIAIGDNATTGVLAATAKGLIYQGMVPGIQSSITMAAQGFSLTGAQTSHFKDLFFTGGITKSVITSAQTTTFSNVGFAGNVVAGAAGAIANTGNMTLVGGNTFANNTAGTNGGAITNTGIMTINDGNTFTNNVGKFGGAIHNSGNGQLVINSGVTFNGNNSQGAAGHSQMGGGAIYNTGANAKFTINGVEFNDNKATPSGAASASGNGGAIYNLNSMAANTIMDSSFKRNEAKVSGGAIYNGGNLTIGNTEFEANKSSANTGGGAIYSTTGDLILIANNSFTENEGVTGGAVSAAGSLLTVNENTFTKNTAGTGGAITSAATNTTITNSTFFQNSATGANGGAAIYATKDITIANNTFEENSTTTGTITFKGGVANVMKLDPGNIFLNNTASGSGAAINAAGGTIEIVGNTFENNTSTNSAGAIVLSPNAIVKVKDSTFTNNTGGGNSGGAINLNKATLILEAGNTFTGSSVATASGYGGGVIFLNGTSVLTITGNQFISNSSAGNSGAIHNQGSANVTIGDSLFKTNVAASTGGAIMNHLGTAFMELTAGNVFQENSANRGGGAISNTGVISITENDFINNVAWSENTGTTNQGLVGGAFFNSGTTAAFTITDTNFTGNIVYNFGGADSGTEINRGATGVGGAIASNNSNLGNTVTGGTITNNQIIIKDINYYYGVLGSIAEVIANTADYTLDNGLITLNMAAGGAINNGGTMTVGGTNITGNTIRIENVDILSVGVTGAAYGGGVYNSGTMTINGNTTFKGNGITLNGIPELIARGGAIYNVGTMTLNSNAGDIVFGGANMADQNYANDIVNDMYLAKNSITNINGTANDVVVNGGIQSGVFDADSNLDTLGTTVINKSGSGRLLINGYSGGYTGLFNQTGGTTIATATFFGGQNDINAGVVDLAQGSSIVASTIFNLAGGSTLNISTNDNMAIQSGQINGLAAGYGVVNKSGAGIVQLFGDHSAFAGDMNITDGIVVVNSAGKLFSGMNTVVDATLTVAANDIYYNANIDDNGVLNHISSSSSPTDIDNTNINFTGTNGTMNFAGTDATFDLNTKIDNGNTNLVNFNNSVVRFGIDDYTGETKYSFENGSTLNVATTVPRDLEFKSLDVKNSTINLKSTNIGVYNNIIAQNYTGTNASILMNINLGGSAPTSDKLVVSNFGAATGLTFLHLNDVTRSAITHASASGIKLVDVTTGATAEPGAFALAGGVMDSNAYEYRLTQGDTDVGGTDTQSFFLRSTTQQTSVTKTILNVPTVHLSIVKTGMNSLRKRLGDIRYNDVHYTNGGWARSYAKTTDINGSVNTNLNIYGMEGGFDFKFNTKKYDQYLYVGAMVGYEYSGRIKTIQTNGGVADGNASTPSFGAYATWFNKAGWYADLTARYFMANVEITPYTSSGTAMTINPNRNFITSSLELGKRFEIGNDAKKLLIEPKAEFQYAVANAKTFSIENSFNTVTYDKTQSVMPWAGVKLGSYTRVRDNFILEPFIEFMAGYEMDGQTNVTFAGYEFNSDIGGLSYEITAGLNTQITKNFSGYFEASWETSTIIDSIGGNIGVRYCF